MNCRNDDDFDVSVSKMRAILDTETLLEAAAEAISDGLLHAFSARDARRGR